VPLAWLAIWPADLRSVLFHQCTHGCVAVHCLQHVKTGAIQSYDGQVVIKGGEPPFVVVVLIGDEVGDAPCQEAERIPGKTKWLVSSDSWFHDR
jgi:hypothetical protein